MICKPCRDAGEANMVFVASGDQDDAEVAIRLHLRCKGGTQCNCQHVIGVVVRP